MLPGGTSVEVQRETASIRHQTEIVNRYRAAKRLRAA